MAIASAVERGAVIILYDERGRILARIPARDGLHGFTSGSVSVRAGNVIYIYNEKGQFTGRVPLR